MSFYKSRSDRGYRGGGGGYRGSRGGGDSWRGGRGSFSSSRGGGGGGASSSRYFNASPSSYESRPSRTYGAPSDRFANKTRDEYGSSSSYSRESDYGRMDDHRRPSPEPPRKRGRPDVSPSYLGSRRSHERSYPTSDYQGRSSGYDDKSPGGGYLTEKGSYREVRESKPDYEFRKPVNRFAPRGARSRGRSSLRSSYRGTSYRGSSRGRGFKGTTSLLARRRMESLGVRKRGGRFEYSRRPNSYRKRFVGSRDRSKKSDDEDDDDIIPEDDDDDDDVDDEEDVVDEEEETEDMEGDVEDAEDEDAQAEEMEEGEGDEAEEKDEKPTIKKEKDDSIEEVKKEDDDKSGEKKKDAASPAKKKIIVKKKVVAKKVVKKAAEEKAKTEDEGEEAKGEGDEEEDGEKEEGEEAGKDRLNTRGFLRLTCPHCNVNCVTFRDYSAHLTTKKHAFNMKNLSTKLRAKLNGMRISQRKKQRVLDAEAKANNLRLKTFFCQICKLNYRTLKSDHFASIEHKKMKEFLVPFCRVCQLSFKSPWAYENHVSELHHVKRKARAAEKKTTAKDTIDLDPSSFMVLDAVGSGDEDEESEKSEGEEEKKEGEAAKEGESSQEKKKKKKEEIKLGADYCKLIEVYFCELCKIYLSRMDDKEKALTIHCRSRTHLQRFVRHRGDQTLRKRAVRLHKELEKEREKEKELLKKKSKKEGDDNEPKKEEEKVWNEMEQNISDILTDDTHEGGQEDEGNAEDEQEDDDSRQEGERYDRFKQSEKADKEAKSAAPNGSLSTDEIAKIDPVKDEK